LQPPPPSEHQTGKEAKQSPSQLFRAQLTLRSVGCTLNKGARLFYSARSLNIRTQSETRARNAQANHVMQIKRAPIVLHQIGIVNVIEWHQVVFLLHRKKEPSLLY
jgi:hypothetical protein